MTVARGRQGFDRISDGQGVPSPRVDAEHLVAHALGITRLDLYLQYDRALTEEETVACRELVRRRGTREPLAYILGEWGFRRLTLKVDSRALIPRPETEVVVERCLALLDGVEAPVVLDVGTGTGAIALAIADERPGATVTAIDVSEDALALARENAERTGLAERVSFARHDVADGLPGGPYDLVVSNPPYVEPGDLGTLQPEVRDWEPRAGAGRARRDRADRAQARARCCARAARSCSRWPTAPRRSSPSCSRSSASRVVRDAGPRGARPCGGGPVDAVAALALGGRARRAAHGHRLRALRRRGVGGRMPRALALKGRPEGQPAALLCADVDALLERVPELPEAIVRGLLPGAYTLVFANPGAPLSLARRGDDRRARAELA